jgi:FkbM family methyltransferase
MGKVSKAIDVLTANGVKLTLVDVGASLEPFAPFVPLLGQATHVAFDPDQRELHDKTDGQARKIVIDKAVVADPSADKVTFFLTENPTCSSTLRPLPEAVAPYLHAHRFDVVDTAEVAATTLDAAMASVGVDRIDWLKVDTQGTDTRLLRSIGEPLWSTVMAIDAEPGLDPSYDGEDTFDGLHREMVGRGFWLADITLTTGVRLRREVFDANLKVRSKVQRFAYETTLKRSPMALGPRYLRTVDSLAAQDAPRTDYLRLWACAFFSGNYPFALDVLAAGEERHGAEAPTTMLRRMTVRQNQRYALRNAWRHAGKLSRRRVAHSLRWGARAG